MTPTERKTIIRQFNLLAPTRMEWAGRNYRYTGALYDATSIRFDFTARKRRGAIIADKVSFVVRYDRNADAYDIDAIATDGITFDTPTIAGWRGVYADGFADIAVWLSATLS